MKNLTKERILTRLKNIESEQLELNKKLQNYYLYPDKRESFDMRAIINRSFQVTQEISFLKNRFEKDLLK